VTMIEDGPEGAHVEYALDDWAVESRQMLRQLLVGDGVPHVWEAGRLVVPEPFEERTDALVDQVAATISGTLADTDAPQVVFDVADLDEPVISELTAALKREHIDWLLEPSGELVVPAHHALSVEAILEQLEYPDALAADGDGSTGSTGSSDEPAELVEIDPDRVLGGLFVAADRLAHSATDPNGVLDAMALADELATAALPFGFDPEVWARIQQVSSELASLIGGTDATDEDVETLADGLRTVLRDWV
jgi:hypothetical protein